MEERERIKAVINRKFDMLIAYRERHIKRAKRRNIRMLEKLREDILFFIDNPDYVRKTENVN